MATNELPIAFVSAGDVFGIGIAFPLVEIIVVGCRFWLRYTQQRAVGIDDWLILSALIFSVGMHVTILYGAANHVLGYPTPVPPNFSPELQLTTAGHEQRQTELLDWITWVLMIPANGLIKLSALFLYRRLFAVHRGTVFDIVSIFMVVICALWMVAFFFATIFGCRTQVDYAWKPLIFIASCNTNVRLDGLMISDLITDIMVWLLPLPVVWRLNMKTSRKLSISGIFLLAAMSLAAAVVRLIVQEQIAHSGYAAHTDVDLTLTTLLYWSNIETGIALIAACLPTLRAVFACSFVHSSLNSLRDWAVRLGSLRPSLVSKSNGRADSGSCSAVPHTEDDSYSLYNAYPIQDDSKSLTHLAPAVIPPGGREEADSSWTAAPAVPHRYFPITALPQARTGHARNDEDGFQAV